MKQFYIVVFMLLFAQCTLAHAGLMKGGTVFDRDSGTGINNATIRFIECPQYTSGTCANCTTCPAIERTSMSNGAYEKVELECASSADGIARWYSITVNHFKYIPKETFIVVRKTMKECSELAPDYFDTVNIFLNKKHKQPGPIINFPHRPVN